MQKTLDKQHGEDEREVNRIKDMIEDCGDQTKISLDAVNKLKSVTVNKGNDHDNCRTQGEQEKTSQTLACNDYDIYRITNANAQAPDCLKTINLDIGTSDEQKRQNMENCLEAAKLWLNPLYEKYKTCAREEAAFQNMTKQCDKKQQDFEQSFCSYKSKLEGTCDAQVSCRATKIKIRDETHND